MQIPGLTNEIDFGTQNAPPNWRAHHEPDAEDDERPLTKEDMNSLIDQLGFDPDEEDRSLLLKALEESDIMTKAKDASGHEHAADSGQFTAGGGQPVSADGPLHTQPDDSKQSTAIGKMASIGTKLLDKMPGGKFVREKAEQIKSTLVQRYGPKTAAAIIVSGQAISWGAFGVGAAAGVPVWIPSAVAMAPVAALAEIRYQLGLNDLDVGQPTLSPEQIKDEGRNLVNELTPPPKTGGDIQHKAVDVGSDSDTDPELVAIAKELYEAMKEIHGSVDTE